MMSQIVMSIFSSPEPSGDREVSSFFETFVPSVWMYLSSKFSKTNRRMREVLPTAASPTRQTFTFIRLTSMENRPTTRHSLRGPLKRYGSVITDDTTERAGTLSVGATASRRAPERRTILYPQWVCAGEGSAMCDEYDDARMKAFWRALADADELEDEEKADEPIVKTIVIEPLKSKPRALVR